MRNRSEWHGFSEGLEANAMLWACDRRISGHVLVSWVDPDCFRFSGVAKPLRVSHSR